MSGLDPLAGAFVIFAFLVQIALIIHFALRTWAFATALRYGPLIYGLGIPAAIVSVVIWVGGKPWYLWLAGFMYTAWALYGYIVEYILHISGAIQSAGPFSYRTSSCILPASCCIGGR